MFSENCMSKGSVLKDLPQCCICCVGVNVGDCLETNYSIQYILIMLCTQLIRHFFYLKTMDKAECVSRRGSFSRGKPRGGSGTDEKHRDNRSPNGADPTKIWQKKGEGSVFTRGGC